MRSLAGLGASPGARIALACVSVPSAGGRLKSTSVAVGAVTSFPVLIDAATDAANQAATVGQTPRAISAARALAPLGVK
jgi:hypothetical protein